MDEASGKKTYGRYTYQPSAKDLDFFKQYPSEVFDVEQAKRYAQLQVTILQSASASRSII